MAIKTSGKKAKALSEYANADLLKNVKLQYFDALGYIKDSNKYFIGLLPVTEFSRNPYAIRASVSKRLIQITSWCKPRGVKVCAILPEKDLEFYAGLFNLAGIDTWAALRSDKEPSDLITDHYFVTMQGQKELQPIYNECSCVFIVQAALSDEEMEAQDVVSNAGLNTEEEMANTLENENTIFFEVPKEGEIKFIDEGSPDEIMRSYDDVTTGGKNVISKNPYANVPTMENRTFVRVPENYMETMRDAMPVHDQPRVTVIASADTSFQDEAPLDREGYLKYLENDLIKKGKAPYGYCPQCGARGVMGERRMNPDYTCGNGHVFNCSLFKNKDERK